MASAVEVFSEPVTIGYDVHLTKDEANAIVAVLYRVRLGMTGGGRLIADVLDAFERTGVGNGDYDMGFAKLYSGFDWSEIEDPEGNIAMVFKVESNG